MHSPTLLREGVVGSEYPSDNSDDDKKKKKQQGRGRGR
jgi:hypothetical protein